MADKSEEDLLLEIDFKEITVQENPDIIKQEAISNQSFSFREFERLHDTNSQISSPFQNWLYAGLLVLIVLICIAIFVSMNKFSQQARLAEQISLENSSKSIQTNTPVYFHKKN